MPIGIQDTFHQWWSTLDNSEEVQSCCRETTEWTCWKAKQSRKDGVKEQFLNFVDMNSQHNGRSNPASIQYYFLPKFSRINAPKAGESNFDLKMKSSVVDECNHAQAEQDQLMCINSSAIQWLDGHRPKHGIMPHQTDYCDTCKEMCQQIFSITAIMKRKTQSGNPDEGEMNELENKKRNIEKELQCHKEQTQLGYSYYKEVINKCYTQGESIMTLEDKDILLDDEQAELDVLKENFVAVLSLDYQMTKQIPYWDRSAQPVFNSKICGVPQAYCQLHDISTAKRQHLIIIYKR